MLTRREKMLAARAGSLRAKWARVRFRDNRTVTEYDTIGMPDTCWCGERSHSWPGQAEGEPHPRLDAPKYPTTAHEGVVTALADRVAANRARVVSEARVAAERKRCGIRVITVITDTAVQVVAQVDPSLAYGEIVEEFPRHDLRGTIER